MAKIDNNMSIYFTGGADHIKSIRDIIYGRSPIKDKEEQIEALVAILELCMDSAFSLGELMGQYRTERARKYRTERARK